MSPLPTVNLPEASIQKGPPKTAEQESRSSLNNEDQKLVHIVVNLLTQMMYMLDINPQSCVLGVDHLKKKTIVLLPASAPSHTLSRIPVLLKLIGDDIRFTTANSSNTCKIHEELELWMQQIYIHSMRLRIKKFLNDHHLLSSDQIKALQELQSVDLDTSKGSLYEKILLASQSLLHVFEDASLAPRKRWDLNRIIAPYHFNEYLKKCEVLASKALSIASWLASALTRVRIIRENTDVEEFGTFPISLIFYKWACQQNKRIFLSIITSFPVHQETFEWIKKHSAKNQSMIKLYTDLRNDQYPLLLPDEDWILRSS